MTLPGSAPGRDPAGGALLSGALALVSGSVVGQALVVLSSPFLTRLYSPQEFGVLGVYLVAFMLFNLISSGRYELAVTLPHSNTIGAAAAVLSVAITSVTALVVGGAVWGFGTPLTTWANVPTLEPYLWVLPLAVLSGGASRIFVYWSLRTNHLGAIARARVAQDGSMVASQLVGGSAGAGIAGLLLGHLLGLSMGIVDLARSTWRSSAEAVRLVRWKHVVHCLGRYRNFPMYTMWGDMANVLTKQLPILLFADLFSTASAGFYVLAFRVANAPVAVVSDGALNAFMSTAARTTRGPRLGDLTEATFALLLCIGLPPFLMVAAFAPDLFAVLFGREWFEAGQFARFMVPHSAAVFIFVPLLSLMFVLERQRAGLVFQLALLGASILGVYAGAAWGGPSAAIALYSMGTAAVYAGFGLWIMRLAGVPTRRLAVILGTELASVTPLAVALLLIVWEGSPLSFRGRWVWVSVVILGALLAMNARRAMSSWSRARGVGIPAHLAG